MLFAFRRCTIKGHFKRRECLLRAGFVLDARGVACLKLSVFLLAIMNMTLFRAKKINELTSNNYYLGNALCIGQCREANCL